MPAEAAYLARLDGTEAVAAAEYQGDPRQAIWLPNDAVAKAWQHYIADTAIPDTTPPPAPTNLRIAGNVLAWEAVADPESGVAAFIIERDGRRIATVPEKPANPFGRPLFQGLQYSDTPVQPLATMTFTDAQAAADSPHDYRVIAVNTVGLESR
jgi:hypothetical protein